MPFKTSADAATTWRDTKQGPMNHGVAYRFAQYAHWLPYATRDMRYEDMAGAMHSMKIVFFVPRLYGPSAFDSY